MGAQGRYFELARDRGRYGYGGRSHLPAAKGRTLELPLAHQLAQIAAGRVPVGGQEAVGRRSGGEQHADRIGSEQQAMRRR